MCVATAICTFAETEAVESARLEREETPILWGFANYGIYSGYMLYGSLVNPEPVLEGYAEINGNLHFGDIDFGYLGVGLWSNSDLTGRRAASYRRAFNEWDFNVHWGRTFWFDDANTWGIAYLTSFVWYWYPNTGGRPNGGTHTTMDWDHSFELVNPYVVPFLNVEHEYHETDGTLLEFGLKKGVPVSETISLTPSATLVWRNTNYGWCFPHYGLDENGNKINSCFATIRLMLEASWKFTDNFGLFAKVAYCSIVDDDLRDAADIAQGDDYGKYKDFAWGGVGVTLEF